MGWQQQTFIGTLVLIFGTGANTGLFVYNGTPSATNPPIFWVTTAAKDPFGNSIPSTAGMDTNFLVYSGTPALGNLIASIANAAFTDTLGNAVPAGITAIGGPSGAYQIQLNASNNIGGITVPSIAFAKPGTGNTQAFIGGNQQGAVLGSSLQDDSGTGTVSDVSAGITRFSQVASAITGGQINLSAGRVRVVGGRLEVEGNAAFPSNIPGASMGTSSFGSLQYIGSGDGLKFNVGHNETSAAGSQLINSTTATLITGSTFNVGVSTYQIKYTVFYKGSQAAGAPIFSIGGTAVTSFVRSKNVFTTGGAGATFSVGINTAIVTMTGPTLLNGTIQLFEFDAWITFSSSGTFTLQAAESIAGDAFTIDSIFGRYEPRQIP